MWNQFDIVNLLSYWLGINSLQQHHDHDHDQQQLVASFMFTPLFINHTA